MADWSRQTTGCSSLSLCWHPFFAEQRVNKPLRIECLNILRRLSKPDELHRNLQLIPNRNDDSALGRSIKLGEEDSRHVNRLAKILGLKDRVLPGCRIEHEND